MRTAPYALVTMLCTAALIAGCNLPLTPQNDQSAAQTAAALTIQAQLTAVAPATFTPVPFPTIPPASTNTSAPANTVAPAPTPTSNCNNANFVTDVTIPDETVIDPGESFTKTWRIRNAGTCSWTPSYAVVFVSGNDMDGPSVQALEGNVNPGQTVDLSVNLKAPSNQGDYTGNWGLRNASGVVFGHFWVKITVETFVFKVTSVTYERSTFDEAPSYAGCPIVTAHITANGAGDVTYHWTRSDNASAASQTIHFNAAGTKDVQEKWYLGSGASGTHWLGIYIDDPNDDSFGKKNVTPCTTSP
jgi:hypothetical protein